jgi:hypothetical protein
VSRLSIRCRILNMSQPSQHGLLRSQLYSLLWVALEVAGQWLYGCFSLAVRPKSASASQLQADIPSPAAGWGETRLTIGRACLFGRVGGVQFSLLPLGSAIDSRQTLLRKVEYILHAVCGEVCYSVCHVSSSSTELK